MNALARAIEGSDDKQKDLALRVGVTPQAVSQWVTGRRPIPAERCPAIELAVRVKCEELRPDLHWNRDESGRVTGYQVPLNPAA
jgi:DNA-binding transcriptional regulator YdaS (Cro superfamily)